MTDEAPMTVATEPDVLDFRRRVAEIYRLVRAAPDPEAGHGLWVRERGRLLAEHRASPLLADHRGSDTRIEVAEYDEAFRFLVEVRDAPAGRIEVATGTDGTVVFDRVGRVDLDGRTLVVDLNFAYHPSCAYDPAWACPLAPPGNRIAAHVPVGELYRGPWAH